MSRASLKDLAYRSAPAPVAAAIEPAKVAESGAPAYRTAQTRTDTRQVPGRSKADVAQPSS
jgi:hypothetical protein